MNGQWVSSIYLMGTSQRRTDSGCPVFSWWV